MPPSWEGMPWSARAMTRPKSCRASPKCWPTARPCSWNRRSESAYTNAGLTAHKPDVTPGRIEAALFHAAVPEVKFVFPGGNLLVDELVEVQAPGSRRLACSRSQATDRPNLGCTHFNGIRSRLRKVFPNRNLDVRFADLATLALVGGEVEVEGECIGRRAAILRISERQVRGRTRLPVGIRGIGEKDHAQKAGGRNRF